ncbi:translocon subunit [Ascosphaera pollenicola]|nr:translocon subunit [Ascosphaera pollenicola]
MYLQRSGSRRSQRGTTLTGYGGLRESNIGATIIEDDERSWRESGEGTTYGLGLSDAARGVPRVKKSYGSEGVDDDGKERGDGGYSSFGYPAFDRSAYTNYEEFLEAEKARGHRRVES